jgi:hypothetical protein
VSRRGKRCTTGWLGATPAGQQGPPSHTRCTIAVLAVQATGGIAVRHMPWRAARPSLRTAAPSAACAAPPRQLQQTQHAPRTHKRAAQGPWVCGRQAMATAAMHAVVVPKSAGVVAGQRSPSGTTPRGMPWRAEPSCELTRTCASNPGQLPAAADAVQAARCHRGSHVLLVPTCTVPGMSTTALACVWCRCGAVTWVQAAQAAPHSTRASLCGES